MKKHLDSGRIANALSTLDVHDYGDVLQCMRCGSCLPTCPTYRVEGVETQSPRGRVAMIKAVIDGRLSAKEDFVAHMYHCLDCRNCQTVCPAGVKVGELVLEARHRIEQVLPQPLLKRFALNYAIRDQQKLSLYLAPMRAYQTLGLQWLLRKSHVLDLISSDLAFMEAILPQAPSRPLTASLPQEIPARGKERGRIGFFLGCAMNLLFGHISRQTINLLTTIGYTVVVPKDLQCCGTPNIAEGERKVYREMAEHNIRVFQDRNVDVIVTDCAACGSELKTYGLMLSKNGSIAQQANDFSAKIRDVSEFLASETGENLNFGPINETVCFHDPCHLRHGQKLVEPQRQLLRRIPGLTLAEVQDEGQCCGSAGIYNITHHDRSMKILQSKVEAIEKTGAQRVVTSNPGCYMQLQYAANRLGKGWSVSYISEILTTALERD